MRSVVNALVAAEARDGIRSVTLMHGFPWADSEQSGASVVIISQDAERHVVDEVADTIASRFLSAIQDAPSRGDDVTTALDRAMTLRSKLGPIIVADSSDNPGGGAAADSTFFLRALIDRRCDAAGIGMIWDPQAAQIAADAGPGSALAMRVGGKIGPMSGAPLDLEVEVRSVRSDVSQHFFSDIPNSPLGLAAALRSRQIESAPRLLSPVMHLFLPCYDPVISLLSCVRNFDPKPQNSHANLSAQTRKTGRKCEFSQ